MMTSFLARVPRASLRIGLTLFVGLLAGSAFSAPAPAPVAPAAGPIVVAPPSTLTAPARPVAAPAPAPAAAPAPATAPPLRIVVLDRSLIMQRSAAGKEMVAQLQNLSKAADTEFKGQTAQLQTEATQLQQQLAILAADARDQKEKEFGAKEQALQTRMAQRQADLQATVVKASQQIDAALEPIIVTIMKERAATLVLDRAAVMMGTGDMDITQVAMDRLDKAMPHIKVDLVSAPAIAAPAAAPAGAPAAAARPAAPAPAAPPAAARPAAPPAAGK